MAIVLPKSLAGRFLLYMGVCLVLSSLAPAGFHFERSRRALLGEMRKRGSSLTESIGYRVAHDLVQGDLRGVSDEAAAAAADPEVAYVLVQDADGQVLCEVAGQTDLSLIRPILALRAWNPTSTDMVEIETARTGLLYNFSVPLWHETGGTPGMPRDSAGRHRVGTLRIGYSTAPILGHIEKVFWISLAAWLLFCSLGLLGVVVVTRWALRPLQRMAAVASSITNGDLTQRVEAGADDEIGRLGRALNEMTEGLAAGREALARRNRDLEAAIGERDRSLAELREAQEQLARSETTRQAEKLRTVGQMASGVAHDFNNLLSVITGRAQILRMKSAGDRLAPADLQASLETIERAARDGAETVRRLQEFSRHRDAQERRPEDLNRIVREAIEVTRPRWKDQAEQAGVQVQVAVQLGTLPGISCVGAEIRELLTNLIFNAVDAMPNGGGITIRTELQGGSVVLTVSDTGPGIDPAIRDRIFEPFFTTRGVKGNGLGLPIVHAIVERHGGDISVLSADGGGAAFRIRLPVAGEAASARPATGPAAAVTPATGGSADAKPATAPDLAGARRVLVADDEADVRRTLEEMLELLGHQPVGASGGRRALELFVPGRFDLVFTDLGMPDLNGWDVAAAIRRVDPTVPIVLVTGWGHEIDESDARVRGVSRVISKPFDAPTLAALVAEVRSCRRAA